MICLILQLAWMMFGHRGYVRRIADWHDKVEVETTYKESLDALLDYEPELPEIRWVQFHDMQTIRNLIPEESDEREFELTTYLRIIHGMLSANGLDTDGIVIEPTRPPLGPVNFDVAFSSDHTEALSRLQDIMDALEMFRAEKDEMRDFLTSLKFYQTISTEGENYAAIASGIQIHSFRTQVKGSYEDIKRFTFEVFNMRPHTALVDFQMAPQGVGIGPTRQYQAHFRLITYGDRNDPPPIWKAYMDGRLFNQEDELIIPPEDKGEEE